MIVRQAEFTIKFKVDLDGVPGWGHNVEDWQKLAMAGILKQGHYHTEAEVVGEVTYSEVCHDHHDICEGREELKVQGITRQDIRRITGLDR